MPRPKTRTVTGSSAPTTELGRILNSVLGGVLSPAGMAGWNKFTDDDEFVPELKWPHSIRTFNRMRTDSQASALYDATRLGVMRMKFSIVPNGQEEMAAKLAQDYNIPIQGAQPREYRLRQKRRFKFKDHQRKALYAGIYGHYWFEQVGRIAEDGFWHLTKLAERPPRTIESFRVAEDGGMISLIQNVGGSRNGLSSFLNLPEIPIDRLVGYVWEQEGANWVGRSWFRDVYKNWLIKDRLIRIDAINHERAGGVPYIEAHQGATDEEIARLNDMARKFRIGDTAGGAVPAGAKFQIARGTNSSVIDSIRYHDEAMARKFMLMVMQLGQTQTGSRALGSTFIDFWGHGLASIAEWFCDTFTEHVIEDDIDWNYGEDVDHTPYLDYEYDPQFVIQDLALAVEKGVIVMDDELEEYSRQEMGLSRKGTPRRNVPVEGDTPGEVAKAKADAQPQPRPGESSASGTKAAARAVPPSRPSPADFTAG